MKARFGPRRKGTDDAVEQFHAFTDLQITPRAHKPADVFDKKVALWMTAICFATALDVGLVSERIHGFSNDDAST